MKKSIFGALALWLAMAGTGHADTLSGKVKDIDTKGNTLTLASAPDVQGESKEYQLVWDEERMDLLALERAAVGDFLTVDAEQNAISRNWKVNSAQGGPLAGVENAIRSDERTLRGEVRSVDPAGNVIVLASSEKDENGLLIEHRVVWDDSNENVREKLEKAEIGDDLSVTASQNPISRNWKATALPGAFAAMGQGGEQTLTGEVKSVDPEKNVIVLTTTEPSGDVEERKLVWDKDFRDQARLENAKIGERLSVRADQNFITRNWNVKSLG